MARDYAATLRKMMKLANEEITTKGEAGEALARAIQFAADHQLDMAMIQSEETGNLVTDKRILFRNPGAIEKARLYAYIAQHFNCRIIHPASKSKIDHIFGYANDINLTDVLFDLLWEHGCKELDAADIPEYYRAADKKSFATSFWLAYRSKIYDRLWRSK